VNILLVTPFELDATGGVSTAVRMLCAEFARRGHRVCVLLPGQSNRIVQLETQTKIACFGMYLRVPYIEHAPLRGIVTFALFLPITLWRLNRFLTANRIDAVIVQYPMAWAFYFAVLRRVSFRRLVITLQGNDVHDLPDATWSERWLIKTLLRRADRVVGVSRSLLDKMRSIFPGTAIAAETIPNGAPIKRILDCRVDPVTMQTKEYILTVGQIIHRKGMDLLVKALEIARERGVVLNLVIVGEGPEQAQLAAEAEALGVASQVMFAGNQSHENALSFFRECAFFVLASRAEGLPLVIVEAMANEKAVVATNIDGVPEIVLDGETGLLVKPEDPHSLADALITLHANEDLRSRLAKNGYERALSQYSWERIAGRYLSLFEEHSA
jgi:glycosyltransferase involved in cell wall biosynthesis